MNYFEMIKEKQRNFLENPRGGIEDFLKQEKKSQEFINKLTGDIKSLFILKEFHKEYAMLLGELLKINGFDLSKFVDERESVCLIQRLNEWNITAKEYKRELNETTALRLARVYASSLEIVWKKLKKIVLLIGLNPQNKPLNIPSLKGKIGKIEEKYKFRLPNIKKILNSDLRNPINHENINFIPPDTISFLDIKEKETRFTTEEIYRFLIDTTIISMAFYRVENSAIASKLKPLLKLSDDELKEHSKTGKLTPEMKKKIY